MNVHSNLCIAHISCGKKINEEHEGGYKYHAVGGATGKVSPS